MTLTYILFKVKICSIFSKSNDNIIKKYLHILKDLKLMMKISQNNNPIHPIHMQLSNKANQIIFKVFKN
jgi:hypothetical protein